MPNVEVKLDFSKLDSIRRAACDSGLETLGGLRTEIVSAQVVPRDQGFLENSMGAIDQFEQDAEIHTTLNIGDTPYARRLYFRPEYNYQTVNNPNAQGEWAEPWLPGGDLKGYIPDTFEKRMKERLK